MGRGIKVENSNYIFKEITYSDVLIMDSWKYNGFEKSLYMDSYHDSYKNEESPLKGPQGSTGFSVYNNENILFGLFEYYFEEDGVYIGLAMNPDFVGRGLSKGFILEGIDFARNRYNLKGKIKLAVHRLNIQGIKAYEKVGFKFVKKEGDELLYTYEL